MPMTFAIDRTLQCVAFGGASLAVFASTLRFTAAGNGARPGLRVLSRVRPSTPSAAKRSCHRHTHGFDLPVARMIAIVPRPSAVARMNLRAPHHFRWRVTIAYELPKAVAISDAHLEGNVPSHPRTLADLREDGNRLSVTEH